MIVRFSAPVPEKMNLVLISSQGSPETGPAGYAYIANITNITLIKRE